MSCDLNKLVELSELTDDQMAKIGGGTKRRGGTTIVNNNPILGGGFGYGGGGILNFPTIIANDGGR